MFPMYFGVYRSGFFANTSSEWLNVKWPEYDMVPINGPRAVSVII